MTDKQVTLVGLGAMGSVLARTLLSANFKLTIWNRTSTRPVVKELVDKGAAFVPSLADAIAASPTTIFCVLGYDVLSQALESVRGTAVLMGKNIVNLTNGTPNEARAMSEWMKHREDVGAYVDGGIMATPSMIATPNSTIFLSGESENVFNGVKSTVEVLGKPVWFGEDPGAASLYDLAMLAGMYGMFGGAITGMGLMRAQARRQVEAGKSGNGERVVRGKEEGKVAPLVEMLLKPMLQELLPLLDKLARDMDEGNMEGGEHPLGMQEVGLRNVLRGCEELGVDGGCLRYLTEMISKVVREGRGEDGMGRVMERIAESDRLL
jgi:NAD binding domain of 6-phosphogluconate dehydrogenase